MSQTTSYVLCTVGDSEREDLNTWLRTTRRLSWYASVALIRVCGN